MQISRYCRIGLKLPCYSIILLVFALTMPAVATDSTAALADEAPHRFSIGYDQGISIRYQINRDWSGGIILSSEHWGSLFSWSSDTNYRNNRLYSNDFRKGQDFFVNVEAIKVFKRWQHFTVRGFASFGGGRYRNEYENRYYDPDSGTTTIYYSDQTTLQGAWRAGLLPGFTYGIITLETRIGLAGSYSITASPSGVYNRQAGESINLSLIYPSNFLAGIIVHVALF